MSKLYVTEFAELGYTNLTGGQPFPAVPHVTTQVVSFTATAGVSAAFAATTKMIRINADGICSFVFGANPTATVNDSRLAIGTTEYYMVTSSTTPLKISAITNT
jgi:hypothetical protein